MCNGRRFAFKMKDIKIRSRYSSCACTDLVPDFAGRGVNEDGGKARVCLHSLPLLVHHAAHNRYLSAALKWCIMLHTIDIFLLH